MKGPINQLQAFEEAKEQLASRLATYGIPSGFIEDLALQHNVVAYEKGSRLFLRGAPADLLFWIFSGLTKVYFPRPEGTRVLVHLAGPSDLIGNVNHIDAKGRRVQSFEVAALTRCTAALVTHEHLVKSLQSLERGDLIQMFEGLNIAWSAAAARFAIFFGMTFRERLEFTLRDLGIKFGVRDSRGIVLMPELTQTDLAEMIGCSRPMISRLIADMKDDGLVLNECRRFILLSRLAG
jgi:CRP/FNR family transcriptional regulator, cyclic AMP receptor protein